MQSKEVKRRSENAHTCFNDTLALPEKHCDWDPNTVTALLCNNAPSSLACMVAKHNVPFSPLLFLFWQNKFPAVAL